MPDKRVVDQVIEKFIRNTWRMKPQIGKDAVQAADYCAIMALCQTPENVEADVIPLITGSVAEFYIEPMLSCIGDIDTMYHYSTQVAIPAGEPPPTELPDEFRNYVHVYEIVNSHLPGYVYLHLRYLLTECNDDGKFKAVESEWQPYNTNDAHNIHDAGDFHGPALQVNFSVNLTENIFSTDIVRCVRCHAWPPQAIGWLTRPRSYDWPDAVTVQRVVSLGCDAVGVPHRQCKQHEWMGRYQWRLSFSRAEIVLLNSWTPVQQILYHLLRIFTKAEGLRDRPVNSEPSPLSNYHIKTAMLWTSELKPLCHWTEGVSFVKMSVELLHIIGDWLSDARYPHYFINDCNLFDNSFDVKAISSVLTSIDEAWLSTWFINNYILRCSKLCPDNVSRLFDDVCTNVKLFKAVTAVINCRQKIDRLLESWSGLTNAEFRMPLLLVNGRSLNVRSYNYCVREFAKLDTRLSLYFSAVTLLHVSCSVSRQSAVDDVLMDVSATIVLKYTGTTVPSVRYSQKCSSDMCLRKASKLMKAVVSNSLSTDQLIEIELSKAYLYRALRCKDSDSDSIYCLANVYLAVLYYTTGQYQTAIDHCTLVMRSRDHSQCSARAVQGEILPELDDDISSGLGLAILHQYVLTTSFNQPQMTKYVRALTTELFAHYLHVKCQHVVNCRQVTQTPFVRTCSAQQHERCLCSAHQLFIGDLILFKLTHESSEYRYRFQQKPVSGRCRHVATSPIDFNTSKLVELLQKSAVDHATSYRQLVSQDFQSIATVVTTDFVALYEYKLGNYAQCLQLSTRNVQALRYAARMAEFPTVPMFIQLLDDDIVSLVALTIIVNTKCRSHNFYVCISQMTLSLYLMIQCQVKLRHSVTSLTQTLEYIKLAQKKHPRDLTLNLLTLQLTQRLAVRYLAA